MSLAVFIACQLPRVYKIRSYFESIKGHRQKISLNASGATLKVTKGPDDPRIAHVKMIYYAAYNISLRLLNMTWVLISPPAGESFVISDNPVTIYNTFEAIRMIDLYKHLQTIYPKFEQIKNIKDHLENLLSQPGVEICMPLSPNLAIFCVNHYLAEIATLPSDNILYLEENQSLYVNLLQGKSAERYIYSIDEPGKPQIPESLDEIRESVVDGLTQAFVDYNFVVQRAMNNFDT
jgi:hypothetical protein